MSSSSTSTRKKKKEKILCGAPKASGSGTCKRSVTAVGKKCHDHDPDKKPYRNHTFSKAGPIIAMPAGLSSSAEMALRAKVNTAGTSVKTDAPGWIYVYWLKGDADATYFKIGCTGLVSAQSRVSQWPGAIMRYSIKVKCNQLCERLIFAMLDDKRLLRYVYKDSQTGGVGGSKKRFLTVRRNTKELIQDSAWEEVCKIAAATGPATLGDNGKEVSLHPVYPNKLLQQAKTSTAAPTFGTRTKEVEWFKAKFSVIKKTVDLVAKAVNAWTAAT